MDARRKRWGLLGVMLVISPGMGVAPAVAAVETPPNIDARELVRRIETQYRSGTSHAVARMRVVTEAYTREIRIEMWGRGREEFLARILEPKKEAGIATLKKGDEIWNFLPKIDRLVKVPSSLMGDGWMGSHVTNDDLVKEDKIEELYDFSVAFAGPTTATIVAVPRPDAAVVWGKIVYACDHRRLVPLDVDYYDEDGTRVRVTRFSDVRNIGGREIPMAMRIEPTDKPGEYTDLVYETLTFDVPLAADLFSLTSLRRR